MSVSENLLLAGTKLQNYEIERVLGRGGFGITYFGKDEESMPVAIKEYFPQDFAYRAADNTVVPQIGQEEPFKYGLDGFEDEASRLLQFSSPFIVTALDYFKENGTAYIVMEYMRGKTLEQWLSDRGPDNPPCEKELGAIFLPLLDGLDQVHRNGMLHRDIKPDNIWIRDNKTPMLIDFGAARQAVSNKSRSIMAIVAEGYSPHEQYAVGAKRGAWTDLYSVGATMLRCISGITPPGSTTRQASVSDEEADPLVGFIEVYVGDYSDILLETINWCMQINSRNRPQSVRDVQSKLMEIFNEEEMNVSTSTLKFVPEKKSKPKVYLVTLALGAIASSSVLYYLYISQNPVINKEELANRYALVKENQKKLVELGTVLSQSDAKDLDQLTRRVAEQIGSDATPELPETIENLIAEQLRFLNKRERAFVIGSTSEEIHEAFNECNKITEGGCIERWFEIEKQRKVQLSPFEIDSSEVTFSQFNDFVTSTAYITDAEKKGYSRRELPDVTTKQLAGYSWKLPQGPQAPGYQQFIDHPVVHVSFDDAEKYCNYNNKRLPTRSEWEYTAMFSKRQLYSSYFNPDEKVTWRTADLIASVPATNDTIKDATTGMYGITGNVWEWVDTPQPGFSGSRQTKGGSWNETSSIYLRSTAIRPQRRDWSFIDVGLRCARDTEQWPM